MELLGRSIRNLLIAPRRIAVVDDTRAWRAIHLYGGALHLAREIERRTTRPHIGLMLPTSGLTPMSVLATWALGRTIVPINYLLPSGQRDNIIRNAELDTVITVTPMIERFGDLPGAVQQIRLDRLSFGGLPPLRRPVSRPEDHIAALLYTSGTSGGPKGVMLTAGNLTANVRQCVEWAALPRRTVFLGVLPQFHCFGLTVLTLLPLWLGSKAVYTARFAPKRVLELLLEHQPTIVLAIPSMLNSLLNAKDATREHFSSVRYLVSGGEPLPQSVFDGFRERFGITLNEGYGLTETSPVTNWCRPEEHKRGSVGPALPGVQQKIVSLDGSILGANEEGEVRIKGPNLMKGYYKLEEETAAAFDEEGFFRTGDIGRIDADGHLFITGRLKEMMVIGGENVFPRTIEEVLDRHPDVLCSAVIGIPDPVRGEAAVAFVELVAGADFDETLLRGHCRQRLAPYQVPRRVIRLETMPRNATGKVLRRELRAILDEQRVSL
ncbi:MAG: class I adenylate-forming enzyme family protein [Candidatus Eisenbacteria bacterium]